MSNQMKVLQIGSSNWQEEVVIDEEVFEWIFLKPEQLGSFYDDIQAREEFRKEREKELLERSLKQVAEGDAESEEEIEELLEPFHPFQVVLVEDINVCEELPLLSDYIAPYIILSNQDYPLTNPDLVEFSKLKMIRSDDFSQKEQLVNLLPKAFFQGQYGDKLGVAAAQVSPGFKGKVVFQGNSYLSLSNISTSDFQPLVTWAYSKVIYTGQLIECWLEFLASSDLEVQLELTTLFSDSPSDIVRHHIFSQEELKQPLLLTSEDRNMIYSVTLWVKGMGNIKIGPFHHRYSRGKYGSFLLGGERLVDANRQELFTYFDPGDLKPPLNVYFSGFRPAEGFEGYFMMKGLGAPFLLVTDPRLEGGDFYLGSEELEQKMEQKIRDTLDFLGFSEKELVLSGLSMGTFGSLYYGSRLSPKAIVIGKPLASLGAIATSARLNRPEEFGTAFDVLFHATETVTEEGAENLNAHFWNGFDKADFSETLFAIAYMKHDDYDKKAYPDILDHLKDKGAKVISKGLDGRHGDASSPIIIWFLEQYKEIMRKNFGRE